MLYVAESPAQTFALPLMAPGAERGDSTDTAIPLAGEAPQALLAVTVTVPPLDPAVAVMEFVVEVPDQAPGKAQV
jgi:hypothetical protein